MLQRNLKHVASQLCRRQGLIMQRTFSSGNSEASDISITLYQYEVCPFSNQVKAYLDYNGLNYTKVEVNPFSKAEIKFAAPIKKTPVAIINGETVPDSKAIIRHVANLLASSIDTHKQQKQQQPQLDMDCDSVKTWSEWSDKKLSVLMYPNINSSISGSWKCFEYVNDVKSWTPLARTTVRTLGPLFMFLASKGIKKKYKIENEQEELFVATKHWTDNLQGKCFLDGDNISLPDLLVFGVLRSIENMPTFHMMMSENEELKRWYARVEQKLQSNSDHRM